MSRKCIPSHSRYLSMELRLKWNCAELNILGLTLDFKLTFETLFVRFLDQLLKGLISWSPVRCRTSEHRITFIPLSMSLWNDLDHPMNDGVQGIDGF